MSIRTKALRDPVEEGDGFRLLIARYRPRGVRKGEETWDGWDKRLAPSVEIHAVWFGRRRAGGRVVERGVPRLAWEDYVSRFLSASVATWIRPASREDYVSRFLAELESPDARAAIHALHERSTAGATITLLCYCEDESRCHRTLVKRLADG